MQKIKTLQQAIQYFSNEAVCVEFISRLKWADGKPCCPKCGSDNVVGLKTRPVFQCREKGCKKQFSVKVGTPFEDSALPLTKLLPALWFVCNAKNGISSCELGRALGIRQATAWHLLHRCREIMRTGTFRKLQGEVEVDETYIGGKLKFMHKDRLAKMPRKNRAIIGHKTVVMGMIERGGEVRAKVVDNAKHRSLLPEISENIEQGSKVYTDKLASYRNLSLLSYDHSSVDHRYGYVEGATHTNTLEGFWNLFKRSVKGTYTQLAPFHVDRYLDEQTFRYNNRKVTDFERFEKAVSQMFGKKLTYAELTGATS